MYIIKDDDNRDPEYIGKLEAFKSSLQLECDIAFVEKLAESSLQYQHKIQSSTLKKRFLSTVELDRQIKLLHPLVSSFYDFKLPPMVGVMRKQIQSASSISRHMGTHPSRISRISHDDLLRIKTTCIRIVEQVQMEEKPTKNMIADMCLALMIITGRRLSEILSAASFECIDGLNYQVAVTGLLKSWDPEEVYAIPVLIPSYQVVAAMGFFRRYVTGTTYDMARRRSVIAYGCKLTHTERRNVYTELVWAERSTNGFATGCSKIMFSNKALCHEAGDFKTTAGYMAMTIEDSDYEEI